MANEASQGKSAKKRRPTVEQVTVDRAIELLQLHKEGDLRGSPIVTVVRDPKVPQNIMSISVAESEAFIGPGER